jgi:hypothetical protein
MDGLAERRPIVTNVGGRRATNLGKAVTFWRALNGLPPRYRDESR